MVHEQPQLPGGAVEPGNRQVRLAERCPCHREGVDRVGLPVGPRGVAGMGHHLRRYPHEHLAGGEQVRLEPARQVSTVLDREATVRPERMDPADELQVRLRRRGPCRLLSEPAARLVDHHRGVGALVRVDAHDHHRRVPFSSKGTRNRSVGTPQWGRGHAPIKPRRPVLHVRGAARAVRSTRDTQRRSQPLGHRPA